MEKHLSDKMILDKLKQMLDYLYDTDMFQHLLKDETFYNIFGELYIDLSDKYLIFDDQNPYSENSEEFKDMKQIEWFGEDLGFAIKDNEYFFLIRSSEEGDDNFIEEGNDVNYWYIDKINTNNLEMARKILFMFEFLEDLNSIRQIKIADKSNVAY